MHKHYLSVGLPINKGVFMGALRTLGFRGVNRAKFKQKWFVPKCNKNHFLIGKNYYA